MYENCRQGIVDQFWLAVCDNKTHKYLYNKNPLGILHTERVCVKIFFYLHAKKLLTIYNYCNIILQCIIMGVCVSVDNLS